MFRCTSLCGVVLAILITLTMKASDGSRLVKLWNRDYVVKRFGLYTYTVSDIVQSIQSAISPMFGYDKSAKVFRDFYSDKSKETREKCYIYSYGKYAEFLNRFES